MIAHNVLSALPCLLLGVALLLATPSSGANILVNWFIPSGTSLPSKTAVVGDTATFGWDNLHDVYVHPSGDCDETGRILVAGESIDDSATYTFMEDDVGELVFVCNVGTHCEDGMILTFTVSASTSPGVTSAPTPAPTSGAGPIISQSSITVVALMVCTTAFAYAGL
eukprot:CAMPEP_0198146884 /NCGR_PEP_ID=MMETSP1443-20131203/32061_1 /TAXON_ID=186043 /ORGANISM="Entomoneis sp., Strain CCMP2396" /LENGTH=166 /DNA_ID=CAMNT_0043810987 /DNA_START=41 /DNA_END=541 /DNA_ORIENTATION=-